MWLTCGWKTDARRGTPFVALTSTSGIPPLRSRSWPFRLISPVAAVLPLAATNLVTARILSLLPRFPHSQSTLALSRTRILSQSLSLILGCRCDSCRSSGSATLLAREWGGLGTTGGGGHSGHG